MGKKILLFLLVAFYLLMANSQTSPTPTLTFDATYAETSNVIFQSSFQYKWVQMLIDPTTSKIRQTFMDSQGTANKTQFQLSLTGVHIPIAISASNFTCAIIREISTGNLASYLLDSAGSTISMFNDMSYIDLTSINVDTSNFSITQNCKALKINTKIYHYVAGTTLQYVQDVLPFTFTEQVMYDPQLSMLINNGSIYNYNETTKLYELQRTDTLGTQGAFIRSDIYPDRVIISTGVMVQNKIVFNISINHFIDGQLIKIQQFKDQSYFIPVFLNDRSLSRIFYTTITSTGAPKINGLFINYRMSTVSKLLIPQEFYTFEDMPFVLITQNYLYIRQVSEDATICRQFIMQFLGNQILTIKSTNYTQAQNSGFKRAVIQQRDTQISVFLQMVQTQTDPYIYVISQMVYDKITSSPTIPNAPDPNLFSFTYPGGATLLRSSVNPKWMHLNFDGASSTTITGQLFAIGETNNKITITGTQVGNWGILGGTDITLNCAVAFDSINHAAKVFYYNQTTRAVEVKADVTSILTAWSITDPSTVQFDVSDECTFFKIDVALYRYNGTQYLNHTSNGDQNTPYNYVNAVFDETFKIAVINGSIYQYDQPNNKYILAFTPTTPFLSEIQIFLNVDKLIILSSTTNSANPPVSQYRVDYIWSNGTNWMSSDVSLEGSSLYQHPGIQISPNFQSFGIGGIKQDGSPFIYGRYVQNATVKQITIPSEMMYNNQIPYVRLSDNYLYYRRLPSVSTPISQNHEAFYQIDKSNGLLKFINKRNLTATEQAIWKNTFVKQINNSMVVFYETQDANTVKLTQRLVGNANGGGAPTANIVESDTGVLMIGNKTYMCSVGCSSCLTADSCEQCAEGFALESVSQSCIRCKGSCKTCATSDASTCTSCFPGTFLSVDSCLPCDSNCLECDALAITCTVCKPGMILEVGDTCSPCLLSNCVNCQDASTCLKCRPGFALNSSNLCVQCTSSCSQCDPTNVLTCLACKDGFELNITSSKCIKCPDHCKVCVNQVCSECNRNFRVTSSGNCAKKCEFPCMSCSDTNPSSCLSCSGQYVLSASKCIPNTNCNSTSTCQKCAVGYILFQGKCYPCQAGSTCKQCDLADPTLCLSCVKGFYLDQASICVACPNQCTGCETENSCTSCKDGYTLPADSTTSQCLACESPCQTCISSTTNCLTCMNGYKLQGWKCRSKINIEWVFELDLVFSGVTTAQILSILEDIATLLGGIPIDSITLMDAYQGSTVLSGSSDASTAADVSTGLTSLATASAGATIGGVTIVSSTFTGNDGSSISAEQSSNTLTVILAVVIPVVVITAIIVVLILYKKGVIFAKSVAVSQQVQLQSQDNINLMNLKEYKVGNNQLQQQSHVTTFGLN